MQEWFLASGVLSESEVLTDSEKRVLFRNMRKMPHFLFLLFMEDRNLIHKCNFLSFESLQNLLKPESGERKKKA